MSQSSPTSLPYLTHIDGLRAIAVMAVLLFHVDVDVDVDGDIAIFSGGFVGVDVFFVISGFLITRLIYSALATNTFSLSGFYARRVRRLFPSLFTTIAISFLAGIILFTPDELERFGGAVLNAALSLSNLFFWLESGYFDAASSTKPLLHTWSLGVEEQFYLLWPFALFLFFRVLNGRFFLAFFLVLFAAGLSLAHLTVSQLPSAAFFLTPFRIFEFAAGAIVFKLYDRRPTSVLLSTGLSIIGLSLIGFAIIRFDAATPLPGLNAMIPVTGAALLIWTGDNGPSRTALSARPMKFLGKISYPLYLVHWPIIVFYPYVFRGSISDLEKVILLALSLIAATGMHKWIEEPLRGPKSSRRLSAPGFGLACALCAVAIAAPAASAWAANGWPWRFGQRAAVDLDELRRETLDMGFAETGVIAFDGHPDAEKILIIGDSHSIDVANALHMTLPREDYVVKFIQYDDECLLIHPKAPKPPSRALNSVKQKQCNRQLQILKTSPKIWYANTVILSNLWSLETAKHIDIYKSIISDHSQTTKIRFIVLGVGERYPTFLSEGLRMLRDGDPLQRINAAAYTGRYTLNDEIDVILARRTASTEMEFFRKHMIMCENAKCDFVLKDGRLAFYDESHWTLDGARHFGKRLAPMLFDK